MYDRAFFKYSMETADKVYVGMATVALAFVLGNMNWNKLRPFGIAMIGTPLGVLAGLVVANLVAGILLVMDKGQRW